MMISSHKILIDENLYNFQLKGNILTKICNCSSNCWRCDINYNKIEKTKENTHHCLMISYENINSHLGSMWVIHHVIRKFKTEIQAVNWNNKFMSFQAELSSMSEVSTTDFKEYNNKVFWMDDNKWHKKHPEYGPIPDSSKNIQNHRWPTKMCSIFIKKNIIHKVFINCSTSNENVNKKIKEHMKFIIEEIISINDSN